MLGQLLVHRKNAIRRMTSKLHDCCEVYGEEGRSSSKDLSQGARKGVDHDAPEPFLQVISLPTPVAGQRRKNII